MKKLMTILWIALLGMLSGAQAQVTLTGTSYTQDFDDIGNGLPAGWMVYMNAANTTEESVTTAKTAWNNTTGAFKNLASADGLTSSANATTQGASTDRILGVRQTSSAGDPGATFRFAIANTTGKTDFNLSFKLQSLDVSSARTVTWAVQYSVGSTIAWTTATTIPATPTTGGSAFSNTDVSVDFGSALDNISNPVYIRIVALNGSDGTGNRPTSGIDDFVLVWSDANVPCEAPTDFEVTGTTHNSATLSWDNTAIGYSLKYGIGAETVENPWTIVSDATNPLTLSSLIPQTTYSYQVKSVCGHETESDWSAIETFTTEAVSFPEMGTPVAILNQVTVSATQGSYDLGSFGITGTIYNAGNEELAGNLDYTIPVTTTDELYSGYESSHGIVASFAAATQTVKIEVIDFELLKAAVAAAATPADKVPAYIQWTFSVSDVEGNASVLPAQTDMPVAENTNPLVLASWETNGVTAGSVTYPVIATESNLVINNTPQLTLGSGVANQTSGPGANLYPIILNAATADLSAAIANNAYWEFSLSAKPEKKLTVTEFDINLRRTANGPKMFAVYYSLDAFATNPTAIGAETTVNTVGANGEAFTFENLTISDITGTITFRIYVWGGTPGASNNIGIGRLAGADLAVMGISESIEPVTCVAPITFSETDVTYNSATLNWDNTATDYSLKYGIGEESAENSWTTLTSVTNPVTISDLLSNSTYSYQVKSVCGVGDESNWSAIQSFETEEIVAPTITTDMITDPVFTGDAIVFTVSTTPGDYTNTPVVVKATYSGDDYQDGDISLWYLEVNGPNAGQYLPANIVDGKWTFGIGAGFPLSDATSTLKIVANNAGVYDCQMDIVRVSDNEILGSATGIFTAVDRIAPTITTNLTTDPIHINTSVDFAVSTTTGDYANTLVVVKATYSGDDYQDGDISLWYLEVNGPNAGQYLPANIVDGEWTFGPVTGFPLSDITTDLRAMANSAGTYDYQLDIVRVSDNEILGSLTGTIVAGEYIFPTITTDLTTDPVFTGDATVFTVSTTPGDYTNTPVVVKATYSGGDYQDGDISLWYLEVNGPNAGQYLPANIVDGKWTFGIGAGFPLSDATSTLKIVANNAGVYDCQMDIVRVSDNEILGSATGIFTAVDRIDPVIITDLTTDPLFTGVVIDFTVSTTPGDYADTLVVIKVTYSGDDYQDGDFSLWYLEVNGEDAGQYLPADIVDGEWIFEPSTGFLLSNSTTDLRVVANNAGTYDYQLDIIKVSDGTVLGSATGAFTAIDHIAPVITTDLTTYPVLTGNVTEFTVSTTPGDYANTPVVVKTAYSSNDYQDGDISLWYLEVNGENAGQYLPANIVEGGWTFGPETGFPLLNASSSFRIVANNAGIYNYQMYIVRVSDESILSSATGTFTAVDLVSPTITTDLTTDPVYVEDITGFSVSTITGDYANTPVVVKATYSGDDYQDGDLSLWYLEVNGENAGQYLPVNITNGEWILFGPVTGFPLSDTTSSLRIVANNAGIYNCQMDIIRVSDGAILGGATRIFTAIMDLPVLGEPLAQENEVTVSATQGTYTLAHFDVEGIVYNASAEVLVPDLNFNIPVTTTDEVYTDYEATYGITITFTAATNNLEIEITDIIRFTEAVASVATTTDKVPTLVHWSFRAYDTKGYNSEAKQTDMTVGSVVAPTITTDLTTDPVYVEDVTEFSVSTTTGDYANTPVVVKATYSGDDYADGDLSLWYLEVNGPNAGQYLPANITNGEWIFGPVTGFPLSDATSYFRIVANNAGIYDCQMEIIRVSDGVVLGGATGTFTAIINLPVLGEPLAQENEVTVSATQGTYTLAHFDVEGIVYNTSAEVLVPDLNFNIPVTTTDEVYTDYEATYGITITFTAATNNLEIEITDIIRFTEAVASVATTTDKVPTLVHWSFKAYDAEGNSSETKQTDMTVGSVEAPTIATDLTTDPIFSSNPVDFTVTTTTGSYAGYPVRVKFTLSGDDYTDGDLSLWYLEVNGENAGQYLPATIVDGIWWFGSETGFPLINGTYQFKVEAIVAGEYEYTLDIVNVNSGAVLATTGGTLIATGSFILPRVNQPVVEVNKVTVPTTPGTYAIVQLEIDGAVYNENDELLIDNLDLDIPTALIDMVYTQYEATYGITIAFTVATQTYEVVITDLALFRSVVAAGATTVDKIPTRIHWWFVAHDVAGNVGTETVQIDMPVDVLNHPTISTTLPLSSTVLETLDFGVTTVGNDFLGEMVNVRLTLSGDDYADGDLSLSYLEVNGENAGQYLPANIVNGVWVFGPVSGFPLINGTSQFKITANAAGEYDYTLDIMRVSDNVSLAATNGTYTANHFVTTITTPPTATAISYGMTLSNSVLENGEASTLGTFAWADADSVPYMAGNHEVIFTPADPNYSTVTGIMVNVTVNFTAPTVLTDNLAASFEAFTQEEFEVAVTAGSYSGILSKMKITFGGDYSNGDLTLQYYDAGENPGWNTATITDGTWYFYPQDPSGFPLATENIQLRIKANTIGEYSYTIDLESADARFHYNVADMSDFEVVKATPVIITLPAASNVIIGQPLSTSTLSGGVVELADGTEVPGTFAWVTPETVVSVSGQQSVIFTPTDNGNINTVTDNVEVTALPAFTITATAGTNGTISPSGDSVVLSGNNVVYTITPDEGYHIDEILVDGSPVTNNSTYTFENVTADHTIEVSFAMNTYTITASVGTGNGQISPVGESTVNYGATPTYTFTPEAHWHVLDVRVDGVSQGAMPTYTFAAVSANHTIEVDFRIDTVKVTATANVGGTITPGGEFYVNYGSDQAFEIEPNTGYHIVDVVVNGVSEGAIQNITVQNITEPVVIVADFGTGTYTIVATASSGGSISAAENPYEYGSDATFEFTPDPGYEVSDVLVDGVSQGVMSSYTFEDIDADHTIHVDFAQSTCNLVATGLTATVVSSTEALLSWSDEGVNYTVRYKKEGDVTYTTEDVTTNSLQLEDLAPNTIYYWNVQCKCSEASLGAWSAEATFTTHGTGIDEMDILPVKVYSNQDNIYIVNETQIAIKEVQVFDIYGRMVYQGTAQNSPEVIQMTSATGNYIVRIISDKQMATYKVYIQK